MSLEILIGFAAAIFVLVVFARIWAKYARMSPTVTLKISVRGRSVEASGASWKELVENLVKARNNYRDLSTPCDETDVWDAIAPVSTQVANKLIEYGAWEMLSKHWGEALESRALKMLSRESWIEVAELLPWCGASTRAILVEAMRKVVRDEIGISLNG